MLIIFNSTKANAKLFTIKPRHKWFPFQVYPTWHNYCWPSTSEKYIWNKEMERRKKIYSNITEMVISAFRTWAFVAPHRGRSDITLPENRKRATTTTKRRTEKEIVLCNCTVSSAIVINISRNVTHIIYDMLIRTLNFFENRNHSKGAALVTENDRRKIHGKF